MNKASINNKELSEMLSELNSAPKIYSPSIYWQNINKIHIERLANDGMKNFKLSINREYFSWGVSEFRHQLLPVLSELQRGNIRPFIKSKLMRDAKYVSSTNQFAKLLASFLNSNRFMFFKISYTWLKLFNNLETFMKIVYRIYVSYLYDYVGKIDNLGLLKKISEPSFGSPLLINYRERLISQDICNSVQEFYSITENSDLPPNAAIAEIGAGYGRLAYVFLKTLPKISYCIVDIPPALYISQEYLKKVFPKEKIFSFRPFRSFKKVEKEFNASRIKFLLPHQIEYLPEDSLDIVINISSFHEMSTNQIKTYFKQVDRLSRGYLYTKQWKRSWAVDNKFIQEYQYPVPKSWKTIFHRTHSVQRLFFEALYKTR